VVDCNRVELRLWGCPRSPFVASRLFISFLHWSFNQYGLLSPLQVEADGSIVKIRHGEKLDDYMKFFDGLPA
jgi:hypothetical protein